MPTIDTSIADDSGRTVSEDGYLPRFNFSGTFVKGSSELLSVSKEERYRFKTKRRKHNGIWLDFMAPSIDANWTELELDPTEIAQIKTEISEGLKEQISDSKTRVDALQTRVDSIDYTDAQFIKDPDNALIKAITQYKKDNQTSFADLVINGQEGRIQTLAGAKIDKKFTDAGLTIDGIKSELQTFADYKNEAEGKFNTVGQNINGLTASLKNYAIKEDLDKVNGVVQKLDAENAELTNSVSKGVYI